MNTQLNKLKSAAKNKAETSLRLNKKDEEFEDEELPHDLSLTTRKTTKTRNSFANNMTRDIKLSKAGIPTIIQSNEYFGSLLGNLGKKTSTNIDIHLVRDNLAGLVNNLTSNAIIKFERKNKWKRSYQSRREIYFIYFK